MIPGTELHDHRLPPRSSASSKLAFFISFHDGSWGKGMVGEGSSATLPKKDPHTSNQSEY